MVGDIVDKSNALKQADEANNTNLENEEDAAFHAEQEKVLSTIKQTRMIINQANEENSAKESYVADTGILDSGNRTEFSSGAVRDIQDDKGSEYLIPFKEISEMMDYYIEYENKSNKEDNKVFQESVFDCLDKYKNTGNIDYLISITDLIASYVYDGDTPKAIMEVAIHFKNGATKYSPRNWEKGMPVSNYISSFIRHFLKYIRGDQDEHHERAILWNMLCAIWTIRQYPDLDDFYLASNESPSTTITNNAEG